MPMQDIITPQWVRDRYLVGIDLTDDDGNDYPEAHYLQAIDSSISLLEGKYDIALRRPRRCVFREGIDSQWFDSQTWYLTLTEKRPVQTLNKFQIQFGSYPASEVPLSWLQVVSKQAGQLQVIPGPEGWKIPYLTGATPLLGFDALSGRGYVPNWIKIEYTAGFEFNLEGTVAAPAGGRTVTFTPSGTQDLEDVLQIGAHVKVGEEVHRVHDVMSATTFKTTDAVATAWSSEECTVLDYDPGLLEYVGISASLPILDTAGDLIIGAGISNQSVSIDGLSQSIGTTSGVENSGYGARETQYRKRLDELNQAIRRKYRRINMAVL